MQIIILAYNHILKRRIKRSAFVENILHSITILPFREEEARTYAQILSGLLKKRIHIGTNDLIIGATAITNNHTILTANEFDFNRIPGLKVVSFKLDKK